MKKIMIVLAVLGIYGSTFVCLAWKSQDKSISPNRLARIQQLVAQGQNNIDFHGKVIDQYDNPVMGAKINIHISRLVPIPPYFMSVSDFMVYSNSTGDFHLKNKQGFSLVVANINRTGYEYDRVRAVREKATDAEYDTRVKPKASNPTTPALFHMRKKGEPALVVSEGFGNRFIRNESRTQSGFDAIAGVNIKEENMEKPSLNGNPLFCDLKIKATLDPKTKTWTVLLSPGNATGGILASDQLLYEAPAEGYQPNYTFTVNYAKAGKDHYILFKDKYCYLRSREPALYTRLHIGEITEGYASDSEITIGGGAVTNPYGDRNLEEATDLPIDVTLKLEDEIRRAFQKEGRRPQKPDLPKLVREWEKNRPLTDKVKALFKQ